MRFTLALFYLLLTGTNGFVNRHRLPGYNTPALLTTTTTTTIYDKHPLFRRFDTVEAAGLKDVRLAGIGNISNLVTKVKSLPSDIRSLTWKDVKPIKRIKSLNGPITYLILAFFFARKYSWAWRNPVFWFGVAFCVKWFRARYIFKIPVWDRQPNWNNVITSKEQEKDLKAFTCKTCGSTIFIAKTREFFFEGRTGIGGLGCFSCGAKGADNFVMDRDRIVEDVADMDDYFEYERPLDFISRAERRALMKEAGGDEEKANQLLIERNNAPASAESQAEAESIVNGGKVESTVDPEAKEDTETETASMDSELKPPSTEEEEEEAEPIDVPAAKSDTVDPVEPEPTPELKKEKEEPKPTKSKKKKVTASPPPPASDDDLDLLGMDDL